MRISVSGSAFRSMWSTISVDTQKLDHFHRNSGSTSTDTVDHFTPNPWIDYIEIRTHCLEYFGDFPALPRSLWFDLGHYGQKGFSLKTMNRQYS